MKNLPTLQSMDIIFTGDRGIVPTVIKLVSLFSRGGRKRFRTWKRTANHVGLIVFVPPYKAKSFSVLLGYEVHPGFNIAEMSIPPKGSLRDAKAILSPMSKYYTKKFWKPRIIEIKRFHDYRLFGESVKCRIFDSIGMIQYDYIECLEAFCNTFDDDPEKMICSRFVYEMTKNYIEWPEDFKDVITPYDIQSCLNSYTIYQT